MKTITKSLSFLIAMAVVSLSAFGAIKSDYCDAPSGHEGNPLFGDPAGRIKLTITNVDETQLKVEVASNNSGTFIDFLQVNYSGGSITAGEDVDGGTDLSQSVIFTPNVSEGGNVTLEILWSNPDWGGRWMVGNITVPFLASCDVEIDDDTPPTVVSANVFGTPAAYSAVLSVIADDDQEDPITKFIVTGGPFTEQQFIAEDGKITLNGLMPNTEYIFNIKAKDDAGNISDDAVPAVVKTAARASQCQGSLGHWGTPETKKIDYIIERTGNNVNITITPVNATDLLEYAEVIINKGSGPVGNLMAIAGGGTSASYQSSFSAGEEASMFFVYNFNGMEGNEATAASTFVMESTYYIAGDCGQTNLSLASEGASVYAYTVNGIVNIANLSAGDVVSVYDVSGKLLQTITAQNSIESIAAEGLLIVKVTTASGTSVLKIMN